MAGHSAAKKIVERTHYKRIYSRDPNVDQINAGELIFAAVKKQFGEENVRFDTYRQKSNSSDFPVLCDGVVQSSLSRSETLVKIPLTAVDFIFCARDLAEKAKQWIGTNQVAIVQSAGG